MENLPMPKLAENKKGIAKFLQELGVGLIWLAVYSIIVELLFILGWKLWFWLV